MGPCFSWSNKADNEDSTLTSVTLVLIVILFVGLVVLAWPATEEKTETVLMKNEIEQAVEVKGLENKFIHVERYMFGAAGAGGLGAPQIFVGTAEKFTNLVPQGERIYVAVGYGRYASGRIDRSAVKKVYWAFIENRAGLLVYENVYTKGLYWSVKSFDSKKIVFSQEVRVSRWQKKKK